MRCLRAIIGIAAVGLLVSELCSPASAQVAAKGIPLGGFRLFPALDVNVSYDDNIYRTQTKTQSDYFFSERPNLTLQSQWGRHALNLFAGLQSYQYASKSSENRTDWDAGGDGRLDIVRGIDVIGGATYAVLHEARTSPDQPLLAAAPTEFAVTHANAAFEYHPYHFGFTVGGTLDHYDFDETPLIAHVPLNNDDRNRDELVGTATASYEFSPGYALFVQGNARDVQYDQALDRSGLHRSNSGYSANLGLNMQVTHLITGQFFVGYLDELYDAPLTDVSGINYGANLDWSASPLWTVHLTASRRLQGTTINNASTEDAQSVRVAVDWAVLRNLTITGEVGFSDSDFQGTTREDKYTDAGVSMAYAVNSNMSVRLSYGHLNRDSTLAGQDFDGNTATLGLGFHL